MKPLTALDAWDRLVATGREASIEEVDEGIALFRRMLEEGAPIAAHLGGTKCAIAMLLANVLIAALYPAIRPEVAKSLPERAVADN